MSYFIEFGLSRGEGMYEEFIIVNKNTGFVLPGDGVDHQFFIHREFRDYGQWNHGGQLIASNSNGRITAPEPGVVAMNIPPDAFRQYYGGWDGGYWGFYRPNHEQVIRCKLLAVPSDPDFTKTLFTGTISFGERAMSCPRIQLGVYPLYPNSATAVPPIPTGVEVSQVKQQLVSLGALDQIEQALTGGPTDPAVIGWASGGPISANGPLYNVIAATLGYDTLAMTLFLTAAAQRTI